MKQTLLFILLALMGIAPAMGQNALNAKADNIVGTYTGTKNDDRFKARITRQADGTYKAQVFWVENDRDEDGNKILDRKNPDKSLRNAPCDRIVLFSGLQYNKEDQCWDGTKIYDPHRGIRAKMKAWFTKDGRLCIKGTLFGISESVYWQRLP